MPSPARILASSLGLGLTVAALTGVAAPPASAADPVELQLLNINDFHGRIDADTTKFATTIETLRAQEPNTLFLSAGDNIGASVFASSVQQDTPTIDVLDALGLQTSAVGNHEFDQGAADLTGRVSDRADWSYLGANVYDKGTTTPALDEYDTFDVGGVTVGVIGVVTEETATIVSPDGIAALDFGDPVEAVNRVADQLTNGDDADGEADVIVAEYHEGAGVGEPDSTLADEVAKGGAFASIVEDTAPEVDVILTGHTHATYAWDAPVTGGGTRPVLQTGSYGANIGRVQLTYDPDTDTVTAYDAANVARLETADTALPRVAAVKTIVDAALEEAAEIGDKPIGRQSADITTAFTGGSYAGGRYAGGSRDDRSAESTLGNVVAEALLAGPPAGEPDFGVTNPGGLRAELLAKGDPSDNPADTDGVITYAEAAAVLPFGNTVSLVELTGADVKMLFEQQWRADAEDPYLQLGVSDNLRVTADPERAAGDRITSIRLDGKPLDPAASYTVSTLNFLAAGGDGFDAFTAGTAVDTGVLDIETFADHVRTLKTVRPDFARQQVEVTGTLPPTVSAGDQVDVGMADLDLTSQGSPANTRVSAFAVTGGTARKLETLPVSGGTATVSFSVPSDLVGEQELALVAEPSRTVVGAALPRLASTTTATLPASSAFGKPWTVRVRVDAPLAATGLLRLMDGDKRIASGTAVDGAGVIRVPGRALDPGTHDLRVVYGGDPEVSWSRSADTRVRITKAEVKALNVRAAPTRLVRGRTTLRVTVGVKAPAGFDQAHGDVRVRTGGRTVVARLVNGKAVLRLRPYGKPGKKKVTVTYLGTTKVASRTKAVTVRVVRRR